MIDCITVWFYSRSPKNPEQKIIKRVIALEGDIIRYVLLLNSGIKHADFTFHYKSHDLESTLQFKECQSLHTFTMCCCCFCGNHSSF